QRLLRHPQRVVPRHDHRGRAQLDRRGAPGQVREHHQVVRAQRVVREVVLDHPHRVVAELLGPHREVELLVVHPRVRDLRVELAEPEVDADIHQWTPTSRPVTLVTTTLPLRLTNETAGSARHPSSREHPRRRSGHAPRARPASGFVNRFEKALYETMTPTAELLERTTNPLHRAILLNFWRHVHLEGSGQFDKIVAPDMMVD